MTVNNVGEGTRTNTNTYDMGEAQGATNVGSANVSGRGSDPKDQIVKHPRTQSPSTPHPDSGRGSTNASQGAGWSREAEDKEIQAQLDGNDEYQDLKSDLDLLNDLINGGFDELDSVWNGDEGAGAITMDNLKWATDFRDRGTTQKTLGIADKLRANSRLFSLLDAADGNVDGKITRESLVSLQQSLRAKKTGIETKTRADIQAAHPSIDGAPTGGKGKEPATDATGTTPAKDIIAETDHQLPKPPPSALSGLEGSSENMNNMIAWGEAEIDRLTTLMGQTDDPKVLKVLENKINAMTRRMQQLSALMNQLMTMMSNLSKMYSDIAMNSIRNMR